MAMVKVYPKYKDSGAPWVGKVPDNWDVLPNRTLFYEIKERGHIDEQLISVTISQGIIRQTDLISNSSKKDSSNEDKSKYKLVVPGDIAYNKMRAWQGAVGVSQYRGIVSPAYIVVRPRRKQNAKYYHYLLRTPAFAKEAERWSYGITSDQWSLRAEHFKMIYCPVPSTEEQKAIVEYLDGVNKIIRRYIREKQKVIKLLNEQKQAVINRAITKGTNPNARFKPSGIDWLGSIPEHWEIVPLRWYITISSGYFLDAQEVQEKCSAEYMFPVIGGNGLVGYSREFNSDSKTIVIGRVGALCGNIHLVERQAWITDNALRINSIREFTHAYLAEEMRTMNLNRLANANAQPLITGGMIKAQRVARPSQAEQISIIRYLNEATIPFVKAIDSAKHQIDLIREYRTRLTCNVVTGKIDVRNINLSEIKDITDSEPIEDQEILEDVEDTEEVVNVDE